MNVLQRFWRRIWRRNHVPRLWPIVLIDFDTREIHYELGVYDAALQRVRTR